MFATSTKTATFLPTLSPISGLPAPGVGARPWSAPAPCGIHDMPEDRRVFNESLALPALLLCRIVRLRRLDRRTSLVRRRSEAFLDEACAHGVGFTRRVDDEQVDGSDVPARANRRPDREHGATQDVPASLRDEDGRMGQEHELAHEVRGTERAGRAVTQAVAAEGDESLDVGDPGRSDRVLHAGRAPRCRRRHPIWKSRPGPTWLRCCSPTSLGATR